MGLFGKSKKKEIEKLWRQGRNLRVVLPDGYLRGADLREANLDYQNISDLKSRGAILN